MFNTYSFFTAKVVMRTRLSIELYVHTLPVLFTLASRVRTADMLTMLLTGH